MLTAPKVLKTLRAGQPLPGRHVLVTAHADDETLFASAVLGAVEDAVLLQVTVRMDERPAALAAGGWQPTVIDLAMPTRGAMRHLPALLQAVREALVGADCVWTHPYEGGHLDHDSAAWAVALAVQSMPSAPLHLEFASYHLNQNGVSVFGSFYADAAHLATAVALTGAQLARKRAALAQYVSQANILRKFQHLEVEVYRVAPRYDFTHPPAPPSRWDSKRIQPPTATWRAAAAQAVPA